MDNKVVKDLVTQFDQSTLKEFDLSEGSFRLYMNKHSESKKIENDKANTTNNEKTIIPEPISSERLIEPEEIVLVQDVENMEDVLSPIVGVVYLQPSPDKEVFKQKGSHVKKGDVICIVEAMKLMNEITATVDGVIREVFVKNEEIVEFNQPLFRIEKGIE